MARIPTYLAERGINTGSTGPAASASSFGVDASGLAAGIGQAASAVGVVAERQRQERDKAKELDEAVKVTDALRDYNRISSEVENEVRDLPDSPARYEQKMAPVIDKMIAAAPSKESAQRIRAAIFSDEKSKRDELLNRSGAIRAQATKQAVFDFATQEIETLRARVGDDTFDLGMEFARSTAKTIALSEAQYKGFPAVSADMRTAIADQYFNAAINTGQYGVARDIASRFVKDEHAKATMLHRVDSLMEQRNPLAQAQFADALKLNLERADKGLPVQAVDGEGFAVFGKMAETRLYEYQNQLGEIQAANGVWASYNTGDAPTAAGRQRDMDAMLAAGKITPAIYDRLAKRNVALAAAEREDFVGSRIGNDKVPPSDATGASLYRAWHSAKTASDNNPNNPMLKRAANAASDLFFRRMEEAQAKAGIHPVMQKVLPENYVGQLRDVIAKSPKPSEQIAALNEFMRDIPPRLEQTVIRQLTENGKRLPGVNLATVELRKQKFAPELLGALENFDNNLKITGRKFEDYAKYVKPENSPSFKALMDANLGDKTQNAQYVADFQRSIIAFAAGKYRNQSPGEAVQSATQDVIDSNYSVATVNDVPVLLVKGEVADPDAFARDAKWAMALVPTGEIADAQADAVRPSKTMTDTEIDAHYDRLQSAIWSSPSAIAGMASAAAQAGTATLTQGLVRLSAQAMNEFARDRAKKSPDYLLRSAIFERGFLVKNGDRFYLQLRLNDDTSTAVLNKENKPFYLTEKDIAAAPRTTIGVTGGVGSGGTVDVPRTQLPQPGENFASPWRVD